MENREIGVLIIDDHELMIQGLKSLLEDEDGISFLTGANSLKEALKVLETQLVDVILMDVNMPEISGIQATSIIKESYPEIKIIGLTMHDDISVITKLLRAGASGYILKRTNMDEVMKAIKTVFNGGKFISVTAQNIILENLMNPADLMDENKNKVSILSKRELEVLELIAKEYSNQQISDKLFISERTVEAHRRNIFTKTKTKSVVGLIKYAIREGLISIDSYKSEI